MREIFVIYIRGTGFIDGGAGGVNRDAKPDGSTVYEKIPGILAKDSRREVIYLPNQPVPDPGKVKVKNGKLVKLTNQDKEDIEAARPKSKIELLEERIAALEAR
ncbi:hypothetical protein KAR91_23125 [Candidatus Pacearchaeota archaeon]|nr:hypothetical protein [Candidatus Pacearchaeota archaeon]